MARHLKKIVEGLRPKTVSKVALEKGEDFVNLSIETRNVGSAWKALETKLLAKDRELFLHLTKTWIVVCEGADGWNDYKLLAHFDKKISVDRID